MNLRVNFNNFHSFCIDKGKINTNIFITYYNTFRTCNIAQFKQRINATFAPSKKTEQRLLSYTTSSTVQAYDIHKMLFYELANKPTYYFCKAHSSLI